MRPTLILASWLLLVQPVAAPAQTAWDMPTEYPQNTMPGLGVTTFAQRVAELSAGRIQIKPSFDASSGIRSAGMLAAVAGGRVQAGDAFAGALETEDPIFALPSLPFLATSIADAKRLADLARPFLAAALQKKGQRLLYLTPWPPSGIWSKAPLKNPSDLSNLSIRTYDKISSEVFASADGQRWHRMEDAGLPLHRAIPMRDRMFALSMYEGIVSFEGNNRISARMEEPSGNQ